MKRRPLTLDYGRLGSKKRDPEQRLIRNISAAAQAGDNLWLASDEGKTIERLSWNGRSFADAVSFDLADYFALPRGSAEVDVEALSIAGRHLWIAVRTATYARSHGSGVTRTTPPTPPVRPIRWSAWQRSGCVAAAISSVASR